MVRKVYTYLERLSYDVIDLLLKVRSTNRRELLMQVLIQMLSPKISVFVVLVSLLALYHRSITTAVSSLMPNPTIKTDVAASVLNSTETARRKADARKKFEGAWETIRSELLTHFEGQGMPMDAREWYKRVSRDVFYHVG